MKKLLFVVLAVAGSWSLIGCGNDVPVQDVPGERVERKPFDQMTKEEKIEFIKRTPMPEEAKQKEIARIEAEG